MPGGDRKGPGGAGPRTGRGMGRCNGNDQPGSEQQEQRPSGRSGRGMRGGRRGAGMGVNRQSGSGVRRNAEPQENQED